MGRRRLEIFGSDQSMRPGWLTVGDKVTISTFEPKEYLSYFHDGNLVGHHQGLPHLNVGLICRNRKPATKISGPKRSDWQSDWSFADEYESIRRKRVGKKNFVYVLT
jgi:hypothetical protein